MTVITVLSVNISPNIEGVIQYYLLVRNASWFSNYEQQRRYWPKS